MSYALAAYALVIGAIGLYLGWLARARRRLENELAAPPGRNHG